MAWNGLPASSGRVAVAEGGSDLPVTWEKPTPAFSKTAPFSITRERPPPPSGRDQRSSLNLPPPSARSSAAQIESCRASR